MLLSFAQFEREIAGERIRDKMAASKAKGMWMGGNVPLGYDVKDRKLAVNEPEAATVGLIFRRYAELGSVALLKAELGRLGVVSKRREGAGGALSGGKSFSRARRNAPAFGMLGATACDEHCRDIVSIALALFDGMSRCHPGAIRIDNQTRQQTRRPPPRYAPADWRRACPARFATVPHR